MIASRLLAELHTSGIELFRTGDQLRYRTRPGSSVEPYRDVITAHKPALLACLDLTDLATAQTGFDRRRFDLLAAHLQELEVEP